ncbi:glycosyltransferase family 4 protein [Bacillus sp. 1P02SD]|uniref:glycosyltransferase family 4 protein n=1 Tax=Bacillus sp. 1P02SD TaxID=3132264 RepID=UPI0039A21CD9
MSNDVLILCQYYFPEYVSSALLPTQLAEELNKNNIKVDVLCGQPKEYFHGENVPYNEVINGVNIFRVQYSTFNNKKKYGRLFNFFSFFVSVFLQIKKIKQYKVIFVYSNPPILPLIAYWAYRLSGVKFVFVGFDLYPDNALALNSIKAGGLIEKLMRYINDKVYSNATNIIAISEDMKKFMERKYINLDQGKVKVIPNWYTGKIENNSNIYNEEFKRLRSEWELIILYTGNMGEAQDLDTIVDGIIQLKVKNQHKDILFVFTGHGSRSKEIRERLYKNNIKNVEFYGFLAGQDYIDILNISDICLVSLKKGIEGLGVPSKTYGYFAYGKPVIAIMSSDTELATNINNYNAGVSISQGDINRFLDVILQYKNNPNLLIKSKNGSIKLHEDLYKKNKSTDKYYNLVNRMLKQ